MILWTALLLGLVGSLHCAGMCGPLVLALPATGGSRATFILGRVAYNLGRLFTYCLLGAAFGFVGRTLALAGLQRWVSVGAGSAMLIGLLLSSRFAIGSPLARGVTWVKSGLGALLRRRSLPSILALGAMNGLLPCGLVYAACAGAVATGGFLSGAAYMAAFGFGTVPMMLGLGLIGQRLQLILRFKLQRLTPACLGLVAVLLILRGMSLGIPYVSPDLLDERATCHHCHQPSAETTRCP
jgi:sulfite exporter TauE/SafE